MSMGFTLLSVFILIGIISQAHVDLRVINDQCLGQFSIWSRRAASYMAIHTRAHVRLRVFQMDYILKGQNLQSKNNKKKLLCI